MVYHLKALKFCSKLDLNAEQKQKSIDMMGDPYAGGAGGIGDESDPNAGMQGGQIDAGVT